MLPPSRLHRAYAAAQMYYGQNQTMEAIARELGASRSTVSRLLRDARAEGLVQITLRPPETSRREDLTARLEDAHGVRAHVVPTDAGAAEHERLGTVAAAAARVLEQMLQPDLIVGTAWGTTMSAVVEHLAPRAATGLHVVQLNGGITMQGTGLAYVGTMLDRLGTQWEAEVHHFPFPAFFDDPETRRALWQERSVRSILDLQRQVKLAVFGVGAFAAEVPSHVYATDYLTNQEIADLRADGVVGDVCTVLLRADGTWRDIRVNARATGPDPDQLARIPRRLLVAAGPRKAHALRAALLAGTATDLVVDETTALRLLALED